MDLQELAEHIVQPDYSEDEIFSNVDATVLKVSETISQEEFRRRICTLVGVIKQLERGHKDARSIACCSIPFKLINFYIEELADKWLSNLSAVRMTGLGKINSLLGKSSSTSGCRVGYTCDNSKWNECIPMGSLVIGINVVMKRLYQDRVMSVNNLRSIQNFLGLYDWMYKNKHLTFGEGISIGNKYSSYREADLQDLDKIPESNFKEKLKEIYPLLNEDSFNMSRGMIMGMANKASTLAAYFVTKSINKLQSSDDSCAVFNDFSYADPDKSLGKAVFKGQINCLFERLGCMNHSLDKSYFVTGGEDMEYNSLYIQNGHLINTAVDLPGLAPVGRNYINDQTTILKNLREMISKGTTPIEAAPLIINISEEELRKVYHNTPFEGSLHQVESFIDCLRAENILDPDHVLPCHGGRSIISPTSLHLDEMILNILTFNLGRQKLTSFIHLWNDSSEHWRRTQPARRIKKRFPLSSLATVNQQMAIKDGRVALLNNRFNQHVSCLEIAYIEDDLHRLRELKIRGFRAGQPVNVEVIEDMLTIQEGCVKIVHSL